MKICKHCGREYKPEPGHHYCTHPECVKERYEKRHESRTGWIAGQTIICEVCHEETVRTRANQRTCQKAACKLVLRREQVKRHHQRNAPPKKKPEVLHMNTKLREDLFRRCACGELYYGTAPTCPFCRGAVRIERTKFNHIAMAF